MKILLHVDSKNNFIVGDDKTGKILKYTKKQLTNGQPFKIKYLKINKNVVSIDSNLESKFKSNAISVLAALSENKRIIGYMIYIPVLDKVECVSGNKAADYVSDYGIVVGKVKNVTSTSMRYIEGKFNVLDANYHKQIYMNYYKDRRDAALKNGKHIEKIVRTDINTLEMRYLPKFQYSTYKEAKGVNIYNFKWWKLEDGKIKLLKRPQVSDLDLSKYCERIHYYGVSDSYSDVVLKSGLSLGAFSHWGLNSVILGKKLKFIGKEAFYDNNLTEIKIPKLTEEIGEYAFTNNLIERLFFCKGHDLKLGEYAFSNNNLKEVYLPNHIISLGKGCFSGNIELEKVSFDKNSKIRFLPDNLFEDCVIKELELPLSIEKVSESAFIGCNSLDKIIIDYESPLNNLMFINTMGEKGIRVVIKNK